MTKNRTNKLAIWSHCTQSQASADGHFLDVRDHFISSWFKKIVRDCFWPYNRHFLTVHDHFISYRLKKIVCDRLTVRSNDQNGQTDSAQN